MKFLYSILLIALSFGVANAQVKNGETDDEVIKKNVLKMLGDPSNAGREYWLSVPPPYLVADPTNFTRFIIGASGDANVRIQQPGGVDMSLSVPAGTAKAFDLKPGECQPYIHNLNDNYGRPAQVWEGKALHVTSDEPIIIYVIVRYSFTSDGYLALPAHGLGNKYVCTPYDAREWNTGSLPNMVCIVAPYDRTRVEFTLGGGQMKFPAQVRILGGQTISSGEMTRFTMNRGDVVVLSNVESDETLSGSLIDADKPVAVFSGQYCTDIPLRVRACDYTVEQDLPMHAWGQIYNVPTMLNRNKPSILRVFARDPETIVWRDGQEILYFTNGVGQAGGYQNQAWVETRTWPVGLDPLPAVYSSNKPIYISLYNPSSQDDGKETDPYSMIITPVEQYQNEILFATPAAEGGKNFGSNFMNLIFEVDENGLLPEDMEFGEVKGGGEIDWTTVRTRFGAQSTAMYEIGSGGDADAVSNTPHTGRKFAHKWIDLPGDGIFAIRSSTLFACYSNGVDNYDSYGFPTATALRVVSQDTLPPTINWTMDCFGNIQGTTTDNPDPDVDGIRVGLAIPELEWSELENYIEFRYDNNNFVPGTPTTAWSLKVEDPKKPARVIVIFSDRSGNVSRDTIEYFPELLDLREVVADDTNNDLYNEALGVTGLGVQREMRYEIENLSDVREVTLTEVKLRLGDQNFAIEPLDWDLNEPFLPREIRQLTITFLTNDEGRFIDSIGLKTDCQDEFTAEISAETGVPGIAVDDHTFDVITMRPDGTSQAQQSPVRRIKNECSGLNGSQNLVIIGYTGPSNPEFTHTLPATDANNLLTDPIVVEPGAEFEFRVTFQPNAVGNYTDQIVFITEEDLSDCDPICELEGKAIETGILSQEYDWEKVRIKYPKQPNNVYEPVGSELITVSNTTVGEFAAPLKVSGIGFDNENGPAGTNNGLNAFSFNQTFANTLPDVAPANFNMPVIAAGGQSVRNTIYFSPTVVGPYEIDYYLENTGEVVGEETRFTLRGHGIVPNMFLYYVDGATEETNEVDFGTITAGVVAEQVTRTLVIENRPTNTDNGDILTITDINWGANATTLLADLGNVPFYIDPAQIPAYPFELDINQSIEIEVIYFTDEADVVHSTDITITSDADESGQTGQYNGTIRLTGNAVRPNVVGAASPLYSCLSNEYLIDDNFNGYENMFYFENNGTKEIVVRNVGFTPADGNTVGYQFNTVGYQIRNADGTFDAPVMAEPQDVTLEQNERIIMFVSYLPTVRLIGANAQEMVMSCETDIVNEDDRPGSYNFVLTSDSYQRGSTNMVLDRNGAVLNDNGNPIRDINFTIAEHRQITYKVTLDEITAGTDLAEAELKTVDIEVTFRRGFITYNNTMGVRLLGNYGNPANFTIVGPVEFENYNLVPEPTRDGKLVVMQTVRFRIEALGNNIFNDPGDLFEINFNSGLTNFPTDGINGASVDELYVEGRDDTEGNSLDTPIETALVSGNSCGFIAPPANSVTLSLDPVCGMGLRPLSLSNFNNSVANIAPNPVTSSGSNIEFSIAFDSETVVRIIDAKGEVVSILNNGKLSAGEYSMPIPVEKLSNGVYIYQIVSNQLTVEDKFVVQK